MTCKLDSNNSAEMFDMTHQQEREQTISPIHKEVNIQLLLRHTWCQLLQNQFFCLFIISEFVWRTTMELKHWWWVSFKPFVAECCAHLFNSCFFSEGSGLTRPHLARGLLEHNGTTVTVTEPKGSQTNCGSSRQCATPRLPAELRCIIYNKCVTTAVQGAEPETTRDAGAVWSDCC